MSTVQKEESKLATSDKSNQRQYVVRRIVGRVCLNIITKLTRVVYKLKMLIQELMD